MVRQRHRFRLRAFTAATVTAFMLVIAPLAAAQDLSGSPSADAASPAPVPPPAHLASPRAVLRTFLEAMAQGDRDRAARTLNLEEVDDSAAHHLADVLLDTLDRIEFIAYSEHPDAAALAGDPRYAGLTRWTVFPREDKFRHREIVREHEPAGAVVIARSETDGAWRFSADTVAGLVDLHDSLRDLEVRYGSGASDRNLVLRLENELPPALVRSKFLTVKAWQWIALAALILLGFALDLIIRLILAAIARTIIARRGGEAPPETISKAVRPFGLAAAATFWLWTVGLLGLPPVALMVLLPAVRLFAMLAAVWAAFRLTDLITAVLSSKARQSRTKVDDLLVPLVRKTAKVFITAVGLIYIADSFDIEILPLLTGLGIGTLAFGLAAKDSIENFFGSVAVIADRPFEVGDWVQIGEVEGIVEELGFRSTRIRTFYNSLITVPNATLVRATVDNYGRRKYRRWSTHINITYDTPPASIEAFCEGIREIIRLHPYTRKDYYQVWMHGFGPHSLDILLYVFWEAPDWQTELRERHRLMLDIIRLAGRLGVEFAFPTQTLHLHRDDGRTHEADDAAQRPDEDAERRAQILGRRAVRALTSDAPWRRAKPEPYRFLNAEDFNGSDGSDDDDDTQIETTGAGSAG